MKEIIFSSLCSSGCLSAILVKKLLNGFGQIFSPVVGHGFQASGFRYMNFLKDSSSATVCALCN